MLLLNSEGHSVARVEPRLLGTFAEPRPAVVLGCTAMIQAGLIGCAVQAGARTLRACLAEIG